MNSNTCKIFLNVIPTAIGIPLGESGNPAHLIDLDSRLHGNDSSISMVSI